MAETLSSPTKPSSPALIALAWIIVGVPLTWGVYKSALNALKLFAPPPAVTAPAASK